MLCVPTVSTNANSFITSKLSVRNISRRRNKMSVSFLNKDWVVEKLKTQCLNTNDIHEEHCRLFGDVDKDTIRSFIQYVCKKEKIKYPGSEIRDQKKDTHIWLKDCVIRNPYATTNDLYLKYKGRWGQTKKTTFEAKLSFVCRSNGLSTKRLTENEKFEILEMEHLLQLEYEESLKNVKKVDARPRELMFSMFNYNFYWIINEPKEKTTLVHTKTPCAYTYKGR